MSMRRRRLCGLGGRGARGGREGGAGTGGQGMGFHGHACRDAPKSGQLPLSLSLTEGPFSHRVCTSSNEEGRTWEVLTGG